MAALSKKIRGRMRVMGRVRTIREQTLVKGSESLEGSFGEVNRRGIGASRAIVSDSNNHRIAPPGNPDILATVRGLGTGVSVDAGIESSNQVVVRVNLTTGTSNTTLLEPGEAEGG